MTVEVEDAVVVPLDSAQQYHYRFVIVVSVHNEQRPIPVPDHHIVAILLVVKIFTVWVIHDDRY